MIIIIMPALGIACYPKEVVCRVVAFPEMINRSERVDHLGAMVPWTQLIGSTSGNPRAIFPWCS